LVKALDKKEGAPAVRIPLEAVHLDFDLDALDADRTESFLVQNQGGRIR
jgi:hypothetical protein